MRSWGGSAINRMVWYVVAGVALVGLVGFGAYDILSKGTGAAPPALAAPTSTSLSITTGSSAVVAPTAVITAPPLLSTAPSTSGGRREVPRHGKGLPPGCQPRTVGGIRLSG